MPRNPRQLPSGVTALLRVALLGPAAEGGPAEAADGPKGPRTVPSRLGSRLHLPCHAIYLPCRMTCQRNALDRRGVPWAAVGRFAPFWHPRTPFWARVGQNRPSAVSWATRLKLQFRGHRSKVQALTLCGVHISEGPKRSPGPDFCPKAVPLAPLWPVGLIVGHWPRGSCHPPSAASAQTPSRPRGSTDRDGVRPLVGATPTLTRTGGSDCAGGAVWASLGPPSDNLGSS